MITRVDPILSPSRGTLVGDIPWTSTIAYLIAIIMRIVG